METGKTRKVSIITMLCLFWIIYNHSLFGNVLSLSTERISIVLLFAVVILSGGILMTNNTSKTFLEIKHIAEWQVVLLIYSVVILLYFGRGSGETVTEEIINLLVFGGLAFLLLSNTITSTEQLMKMLLIISILQCIVILIALFNSSFASFIDSTFNQYETFNYPLKRLSGYSAGIACITSTGVLKLSLGLVSCTYFIQKKNNTVIYAACYVFISFVMTTVARTGLFIWIAGLLVLIYQALIRGNGGARKVIFWIAAVVLLGFFILTQTGLIDLLPSIFARLIRFKTEGLYESFFKDYYSAEDTYIPNVSLRMMFGLGITSGVSGDGIRLNADGGYFRAYASLGLPMAILNYAFFLFSFIRCIKNSSNQQYKMIKIFFLIIFILGEYKEPFLYSRYMLVVFYLFSYLEEKEENDATELSENLYKTECLM